MKFGNFAAIALTLFGGLSVIALAQEVGPTAIVTDPGIPISDMKLFRIRATFNGGNCKTPPGYHPTHYVCNAGYSIPLTPGKVVQIIGGFPNNVTGAGAIATVMTHMSFNNDGMTVALNRPGIAGGSNS